MKKVFKPVFEFLRINGRWAIRRIKGQPMKENKENILQNRFKKK